MTDTTPISQPEPYRVSIRNDDEPIGRTFEELSKPQAYACFAKTGDLPEIDLPPPKIKEGYVVAFTYMRYKQCVDGHGYQYGTEVFIPEHQVIFDRPEWQRDRFRKDRENIFRTRQAKQIQYEQLKGSKYYGRVKNIYPIAIPLAFIDLLLQHQTNPLSKEVFLEMCNLSDLENMISDYPTINPVCLDEV